MKKGLIIIICAAVIIGVASVAYDKISAKTSSNNTTINSENGSSKASTAILASKPSAGSTGNVTKSDNTQASASNTQTTSDANSNNVSGQANQSSQAGANQTNPTTTQASSSASGTQSSQTSVGNGSSSTKPVLFGDIIPGTNKISHNIFLEGGSVYPKSANGFFIVNKEISTPLVEGNITVSSSTPYSEYSGNTIVKYYIIKPYQLNDGPYETTQNLNAYNPADTNFNETANNLTAIAYMQGGVIVATNSSGQTVYVSAKSVKKPITFERGNLQYFEANATINTDNVVPVRGEPGELPTFDTIGNQITQKGLNVVAIAQVNNFTKIIFGTDRGIFSGWVPTSDLNIENYS